MDMNIVSESYKASSLNRNAENAAITELTVMQNSMAAFQVILHDNKTKWVNVGTSYRFGPDLATPIYRIQVESQLNVNVNLIDYYIDDHGIAYADKIIEDEFISYPGSLDAPILITIPTTNLAVGERSLNVKVYQGLPGQAETLIDDRQLVVHVIANPLEATTPRLHVDIWQQPANLAKQFKVGLWSDAHFTLIDQMASMLAEIGQDAVTLIVSDDPWKGWGASFIKSKPADLYETNMVTVRKRQGQVVTDFTAMQRYIDIFASHGIDTEYDLFGLLGLWDLPFYTAVPKSDYPEKIVIRYYDEDAKVYGFLSEKADIITYVKQVLQYFRLHGLWARVRIMADEPKAADLERFKDSCAVLQAQVGEVTRLPLKVAFNNLEVLAALKAVVDYPVTSLYATTQTFDGVEHPRQEYYVCNMPNRPNSFLASPLGETRLLGALASELRVGGMLRWAFNCWASDAQHDINYNPNFFPVGDMGLAYPLENGRLGGSLRLLALMRACEDYALLMRVDSATRQVALASLFNNHDIASWMVDERTTVDGIFSSDDDAFTKFRNILLAK